MVDSHRTNIVEALLETTMVYKLLLDVLFRSVALLDHLIKPSPQLDYSSQEDNYTVSRVSIVCFFLSAKYEAEWSDLDINPLLGLLGIQGPQAEKRTLLAMEKDILVHMGYDLSKIKTPLDELNSLFHPHLYPKARDPGLKTLFKTCCSLLCLTLRDRKYSRVPRDKLVSTVLDLALEEAKLGNRTPKDLLEAAQRASPILRGQIMGDRAKAQDCPSWLELADLVPGNPDLYDNGNYP